MVTSQTFDHLRQDSDLDLMVDDLFQLRFDASQSVDDGFNSSHLSSTVNEEKCQANDGHESRYDGDELFHEFLTFLE